MMNRIGVLTRRERILFGILKWLMRFCMVSSLISVLAIKGWRDGGTIALWIIAFAVYWELKMRLPKDSSALKPSRPRSKSAS
jgi:hypothetical protein